MTGPGKRRYYEIAGITVQVESDLPIAEDTFDRRFESFRREGPGPDTVVLRHHFGLPDRDLRADGAEVYRRPPWSIWLVPDGWVYEGIAPEPGDPTLHRVAVFTHDHTCGELYNAGSSVEVWRAGGLHSLSMFPSDQIWLGRLLPDRDACYVHSAGMIVDGWGLLFVGHSDAGKSTTIGLVKRALGERVDVLCDDRIIVRRWPDLDAAHGRDGPCGRREREARGRGAARAPAGLWLHGTWSHGDIPDVSAAGAPLRAVLFLEQSPANEIVPLADRSIAWRLLLATLIRPLVTGEWWEKAMDVLAAIVEAAPFYTMRFDKSGAIVPRLEALVR